MAVSCRYEDKLCLSSVVVSGVPKTVGNRRTDLNGKCAKFDFRESDDVHPVLPVSEVFGYGSALWEPNQKTCRANPGLLPGISSQRQQTVANPITSNTLGFKAYLERKRLNEFINLNLSLQIAYDGTNITFVFHENQMQNLLSESPCDKHRLEVLRASCIGQPHEMVNFFAAPMKNILTG